MAHGDAAPYAAQDVQEVAQLIRNLESHTQKATGGKKAFSCKKTSFTMPGPNGLTVDAWRFQDWDYKRDDLPIYARGLFTHHSSQGKPEIVIRGYDKFFNVDEVNKTKWHNIEQDTAGPYELSLKENGCIIFISGLSDETLLVCSKHSTGARQDTDVSHALAGEAWIERHLASVGKSKTELARELRRMNATAVAELCDDSFEEHVLAYDKVRAGLYLHGINLNLLEFATYPGHLVHEFADTWGFKRTAFLVKKDISAVQAFLESVARSGAWEGKDVEGFVIRCRARDGPKGTWSDWFFKYKFEEPYLMYRQWREVTKSVIAGKAPRYKKHRKVTDEYLLYARRKLAQNPTLGEEFNKNHGIIAMRDDFLREKGLRGSDLIDEDDDGSAGASADVTNDVVLVPVATIGCGKTTVAVALQKLFNWGHIQNDNIQGKGRRPQQFANQVCSALAAFPAVIADRNNHQRRERRQIIEDVRHSVPSTCLVALHYVHERDGSRQEEIRKVLRDRVLTRGDNHQTIQAGSKSQEEIVGIMEGFLHRFEPVDPERDPDDGFDDVIDLDPTASSRENLETVVSHLHQSYPKLFTDMPIAEDLDEAIDAALQDYKPNVKHSLDFPKGKSKSLPNRGVAQQNGPTPKEAKVDFFCIHLPTAKVLETLESIFDPQRPKTSRFYRLLQQQRRIQPSFHVTLIHRANADSFPDMWERFNQLQSAAAEPRASDQASSTSIGQPVLGECRVQLERVVWDERVMCVVARLLDAQEKGFNTTNEIAHVTVGTARQDIKPKESNDLLAKWLALGSEEESGIGELTVPNMTVLDGTVRAVMQKR